MELDLQTVDAILAGESPYLKTYAQTDLPALELGDFRHCSDHVLDRLVSNIGPLNYFWLGVEDLPHGHALKLKALWTYHIGFPGLNCLHEDTARALVVDDWPLGHAPILEFALRDPLSEEVAQAIVDQRCEGMLSLKLPSISSNVARLLMAQLGELFLIVSNQSLTAEIARIFSRHRGYRLTAWLGLESVNETFQGQAIRHALASNPVKRFGVSRQQGRIVIGDIDMWSSGDDGT